MTLSNVLRWAAYAALMLLGIPAVLVAGAMYGMTLVLGFPAAALLHAADEVKP